MLAFLVAASPIDMLHEPPNYGLNVTDAAALLHMTRQALSTMVNGRGDLAIRCEKVFGIDAATMIRMQAVWNIARAGAKADSIIVERSLTAA